MACSDDYETGNMRYDPSLHLIPRHDGKREDLCLWPVAHGPQPLAVQRPPSRGHDVPAVMNDDGCSEEDPDDIDEMHTLPPPAIA